MRALVTGRIGPEAAEKNDAGHWRIDAALADSDWENWTDPTKSRAGQTAGGRPANTPSLFGEERSQVSLSHARASAERISIDTAIKKLELASRSGRSIDRAAVERIGFHVARVVRDKVMAVPDRIAAVLHTAKSVGEVHSLLIGELARALEDLMREDFLLREEGLEDQ